MRSISRRTFLAAAAGAASLPAMRAFAQDGPYPSRPLRLIVALGPGSVGDTTCRIIAAEMAKRLGQPVVVENKPGAGTNIGVGMLAKARPDGYTFGEINIASHAINPFVYKKLPFDPEADFMPISLTGFSALSTILVNPRTVPVTTVPEFIKLVRAKPEGYKYGTLGVGTSQHVCMEMVQHYTQTKFIRVPYNSVGQLAGDAISGEIDIIPDMGGSYWEQAKAGQLRALAVTTKKRSEFAPELPTLSEFYPGLEIASWRGLAAPANTPRPVFDVLANAARAALSDPGVQERLRNAKFAPAVQTPAEFTAFLKAERERLGPIVAKSGATAE